MKSRTTDKNTRFEILSARIVLCCCVGMVGIITFLNPNIVGFIVTGFFAILTAVTFYMTSKVIDRKDTFTEDTRKAVRLSKLDGHYDNSSASLHASYKGLPNNRIKIFGPEANLKHLEDLVNRWIENNRSCFQTFDMDIKFERVTRYDHKSSANDYLVAIVHYCGFPPKGGTV